MSHVWSQLTGEWTHAGKLMGKGYSGLDDGDGIPEPGEGKNDPAMQRVKDVGPVPCGRYRIGPPFRHPTAGRFTMRLYPEAGTETFGRSGFLIHGDKASNPGTASHGCIVVPYDVRLAIGAHKDRELLVVDGRELVAPIV